MPAEHQRRNVNDRDLWGVALVEYTGGQCPHNEDVTRVSPSEAEMVREDALEGADGGKLVRCGEGGMEFGASADRQVSGHTPVQSDRYLGTECRPGGRTELAGWPLLMHDDREGDVGDIFEDIEVIAESGKYVLEGEGLGGDVGAFEITPEQVGGLRAGAKREKVGDADRGEGLGASTELETSVFAGELCVSGGERDGRFSLRRS